MSLPVNFYRAANNEFIEASTWYEEKRTGLGIEFIAEIEHCITLIAEYPTRYAIVYQEIRRIVINKFPYSIYFRVEAEQIIILAVFHSRRNPAIWQTRA